MSKDQQGAAALPNPRWASLLDRSLKALGAPVAASRQQCLPFESRAGSVVRLRLSLATLVAAALMMPTTTYAQFEDDEYPPTSAPESGAASSSSNFGDAAPAPTQESPARAASSAAGTQRKARMKVDRAPEDEGDIAPLSETNPSTVVLAVAVDAYSSAAVAELQHLAWERVRRTPGLLAVDPQLTLLGTNAFASHEASLHLAREKLKEGRTAYENLDLDGAVQLLKESVEAYQSGIPLLEDLDELATAKARLGATLFFAGDAEAAQQSFVDSVLISPNHKPDPAIFSPELAAAFEEAREFVSQSPTGVLTIASNPRNAEVWVDGHYQGVSPETVEQIPVGEHYVIVRMMGREAGSDIARVVPADPVTLELGLRAGRNSAGFEASLKEAAKDAGGRELPASVKALATLFGTKRVVLLKISTMSSISTVEAVSYDIESAARNHSASASLALSTPSGRRAAVAFLDGLLPLVAPKAAPPQAVTFWRSLPPFARSWWFWTATGVAAAAIGGGIDASRF